MRIKCLSIRQPWVELILSGRKCVENRTWTTTHRGPLAIHASRSLATWDGLSDAERDDYFPGWRDAGPPGGGLVLGVVDLVRVCRPDHLPAELWHHPFALRTPGNWCWVLARPRRLAQPVRVKGNAALFFVDVPEAAVTGACQATPAR